MPLLIKRSGIMSTVQDLGRKRCLGYGIGPGGAMDRRAVRLINILLGNSENAAVIEMHFPAAEIRFDTPVQFAIGGANLSPELDGERIENWRVFEAAKGSTLAFTSRRLGSRACLAVRGGFIADEWLGSCSTNLTAGRGGLDGRLLRNGDVINIHPNGSSAIVGPNMRISPSILPKYSSCPTVRVIPGPEFERLDDAARAQFPEQAFRVSPDSNRMGFRLDGEALSGNISEGTVSAAVCYGAIQLLPDGQLIVLMADHQTTGGYPVIAYVIEPDLSVLAQLGTSDEVNFHLVTLQDAERLSRELERDIALFRIGCNGNSR